MTLSLHHAGLTVSDLDRSIAFYRDGLGLEVLMEQEKRGGYLAAITGYPEADVRMAHLATPDGRRIELFEYRAPSGEAPPREPCDVGMTHVCLVVEDVDAALSRAVAAGGRPVSAPVSVDTGANAGAWGVYIRDPDGITVELFQAPR